MERWTRLHTLYGVFFAMALAAPGSLAWAALDVEHPETVTKDVTAQVEKLVVETAKHDPELADAIKRESEVCVKDLSDGKLENAGFEKEVHTLREVHREVLDRTIKGEVDAKVTELAKVNPDAAEKLKIAFEAVRGAGGEIAPREEARRTFDAAYKEALQHDPKGAEHMKDMIEAAEKGDFQRPTPEIVERMRGEMEKYATEHPEAAEHARAEFERMADHGFERGERYGSTETAEHARDSFEKWANEGTHSAAEIEQGRAAMEHGLTEGRQMENAREGFERWAAEGHSAAEVDRAREMMEHYTAERNTADNRSDILADNRAQSNPAPQTESFVRNDPDGSPIYRHADGSCHNHRTDAPSGC